MKQNNVLGKILVIVLLAILYFIKAPEKVYAGELEVECVLYKLKYVIYAVMIIIVRCVLIQKE